VIGFDAQRRPFVACADCRLPVPLGERAGMAHRAFNWIRRHNSKCHPGRMVPAPLPRRDLGLVEW
jgi:hypothetical protein